MAAPTERTLRPALVATLLAALLGALCTSPDDGPHLAAPQAAEPPVDFARDIRPILSENCFKCHGPDGGTREAGLRLDLHESAIAQLPSGRRAIVPGDPGASALLKRVHAEDPDDRMPPAESGKELTEREKELLERWIAEGAHWQRHWSFVPPRRPTPPRTRRTGWARNPIDQFVLAKLEAAGLSPSPEADAVTLARRATLDLHGLPPLPADVDGFVADSEDGALARLLERLFASPRHGEHMARYWLDGARYADTHGFHIDNVRSLWPWRDWVVRAFNENMRFDRFTIEQLAGDLLPGATTDQRVATGFNRCNPTTGEGGLIAEEYLAKYAMDRVEATSTVWLGLTIACAQCHDHKFDPISQKDFYRLFAFFNSIAEQASDRNKPVPPPSLKVPTAADTARLAKFDADLAAVDERMRAPLPETDAAQERWERALADEVSGRWHELAPTSCVSRAGAKMEILDDRSIVVTGANPNHDVYEVVARTNVKDIRAIRLEALTDERQPGGGVGRASHSNIVLTGFELELGDPAKPLEGKAVLPKSAIADYSQRKYAIADSIDADSESGWAIDGGREDRAVVYLLPEPVGAGDGTVLRFRMKFQSKHPQHNIGRFRLSVSSDVAIAASKLSPWRRVGPFHDKSQDAAFKRVFGPEKDLAIFNVIGPAGAVHLYGTYGKRKLAWKADEKLVDDEVHMLKGDNAATYFHRTIEAPSARPMRLSIGSDDGVKLWVNGVLVLSNNARRAVEPDQEKPSVLLQRGTNHVLLKIVNGGGGYGFYFRVIGEETQAVPTTLVRVLTLPAKERGKEDVQRVRRWYRRHFSPAWRKLDDERVGLAAAKRSYDARIPRTMVMAEREERRKAHLLIRGQYDQKGQEVTRGVPAALPPLPAGQKADRLALAEWLVAPDHPLTARVAVNRLWQQIFGTGLVGTSDDFGSQGEWPSHPELLDWLAVEFVESGWDVRHMLRLMITSATWRQSACVTPELLAKDPGNRLLSRSSRYRLDGEVVRDTSLAVSGLLVEKRGGKGVKPYQPSGIWKAVAYPTSNTAVFKKDAGDALYRRSVYTFWKRTAPPPALILFDAPTREACCVRRARTNTPLQALALMNDVQFVEASRGLAQRMLKEGGASADERLAFAFRLATARTPEADELATLRDILAAQQRTFANDAAGARELIAMGDSKPDATLDARELAAWTCVASVILNLDETVTRP